MPEYTFTVTYTEGLLKRAVHTFMWRRVGPDWKLWLAFSLVAVALITLLWLGDRSWWVGFFGADLLIILVLLTAVWRAHWVNTLGKFRRMGEPKAAFTFSDTGMTVASDMGSSTVPWSMVEEVWELPDCWMIFLSPNQFLTLPTQDVPDEALRFARSRLPTRKIEVR